MIICSGFGINGKRLENLKKQNAQDMVVADNTSNMKKTRGKVTLK